MTTSFRASLPQLGRDLFLTNNGMETDLGFNQGLELPYFAACDLLKTPQGELAVRNYYRSYGELAKFSGSGSFSRVQLGVPSEIKEP